MGVRTENRRLREQVEELAERVESMALQKGPESLPRPRQQPPTAGSLRRKAQHRYGRQLLPIGVLAGCETAGAILHHIPYGPVATLALSAMTWPVWWRARGHRADRAEERAYTGLCWAAATGWVGGAAVMGAGATDTRLWVLGAALSIPWWVHHRVRPHLEAEDPPVAEESLYQVWAEKVAGGPRPVLSGSRLIAVHDIPGGWEGTIELDEGNVDRAIAALKDVGARLKLRVESISVEPHPGGLHLARILVQPQSPLHEVTLWPGPTLDLDSGVSVIGIFADTAPVPYRHYRRSGPVHTLIAGSTDAGKTALVKMLLAEERHSGVIVSYLIDPQRGQSYAGWKKSVHRFASTDAEIVALLRDVRRRMYARNDFLSNVLWRDEFGDIHEGIEEFDPSDPRHDLKMISVTIEEAQRVLAIPEACELVEECIGMSRKCGIKFRAVTPVPLQGSLGGSQEIKDAVASGNVVVLRTANSLSGQAAFNGSFAVDPCELPAEFPGGEPSYGLGYIFKPGDDRPTRFRTSKMENGRQWAVTGVPAVEDDVIAPEPAPEPAPVQSAGSAAPVKLHPLDDEDTAEEKQLARDIVLAWFAEHGDQKVTVAATRHMHFAHGLAARTTRKALTDLTRDGLLEHPVDRGPYWISDAGRSEIHQRSGVA